MTREAGLAAAFRYTVADQATVAAVVDALEAATTTVGTRVEFDHLAP